jgi:ribosomal protein S18 acetylase RimI-like enzyme
MSDWEPLRVNDCSDDACVSYDNALSYLQHDLVHNVLDAWNLRFADKGRYELYVSRLKGGSEIWAHIGIFHSPEADYVSMGGRHAEAVVPLVRLIPPTAVVILPAHLFEPLRDEFRWDRAILTDVMVVAIGGERLDARSGRREGDGHNDDLDGDDDASGPVGAVSRLTKKDATSYSTFGRSLDAPPAATGSARARLEKELVFGAFLDGRLVAVASVAAWLPEMAVIMGVETKEAFRRRGFGGAVVSAAVREALSRSSACSLGVRSDNIEAIRLYRRLGFVKVGQEFWVDKGTGLTP